MGKVIDFRKKEIKNYYNGVPFNAIFYVDAENGDDNTGNGSYSKPFQTIEKALSGAIPGSNVTINLMSNYVLQNRYTEIPAGVNVILKILKNATLSNKIIDLDDTYVGFTTIKLNQNSNLNVYLYYNDGEDENSLTKIYQPKYDGDKTIVPLNQGMFSFNSQTYGNNTLSIQSRLRVAQRHIYVGSGSLISVSNWDADRFSKLKVGFSLYYAGEVIVEDDANLIDTNRGIFEIYKSFNNVQLKNSNGDVISFKDKVALVIKDNSGNPLNVISNIDFSD